MLEDLVQDRNMSRSSQNIKMSGFVGLSMCLQMSAAVMSLSAGVQTGIDSLHK